MKIINNRIMAQSFAGTNANAAGIINDPNMCAGWNLFFFTGKLPTSKEGFDAAFNQKSLADMFNTSVGVVRSPVYGIESGNVIAMNLQNQYVPKGASYYGQIGTAKTDVRQLLPNRVQRNLTTDRNITLFTSSGSTNFSHNRQGLSDDIVFEFDTDVALSHIKFFGSASFGFSFFAIKDDNSEVAMGALTAVAGDSTVFSFASPQTAKKFRLKNNQQGTNTDSTFVLLSSTTAAPTVAQVVPTWGILAHCNTLTHGDLDYSDEIMFTAGAVSTTGPFKIMGNIVPNVKTLVYCPKLRFTQRSS